MNPNPFNGIEKGLREVAWRRKTPVSTGSGSLEALKRIAGRVQIGEEALEDVNRTMGFNPPTPLHRFLAYRMVELGVEPPGVVEDGCPLCGRAIHRSSCRFCGSYVTPQGYILRYSGDQALKALVSWSSGKDSALALYAAVKAGYEILGLLTTVDVSSDPPVVTGHRIPLDLVERQAKSLNLPLYTVELPGDLPPSHVYEKAVLETLVRLKGELGVDYVVYGDIFLRDMMEYKRRLLERVNMKPLYPLEGIDTVTLSEIILSLGFKAVVVAVDPRRAPGDLLCRDYDRRFLEELPATVDPAGEYGEFHTFVYQAPLYRSPVNFKVGGVSMVRSKIDSIIAEKLVCNIY